MKIDITNWQTMPDHCATCPFKEINGRQQDVELASQVCIRNLNASTEHVCHHPRLTGAKESALCYGYQRWKQRISARLSSR